MRLDDQTPRPGRLPGQAQTLAERDGFEIRVELNYHGTPRLAAVVKSGFDLSKASTQAFGDGVYLSKHAGVSHNYIQDRLSEYRYLILVQCIKVCDRLLEQTERRRPRVERQYQKVVTNVHEICKDVAYCIPMYVIKYTYGTLGRAETANCFPSHPLVDRRVVPFNVYSMRQKQARKRPRAETDADLLADRP